MLLKNEYVKTSFYLINVYRSFHMQLHLTIHTVEYVHTMLQIQVCIGICQTVRDARSFKNNIIYTRGKLHFGDFLGI